MNPDEIAFFDDLQINIDTASKFGIRAFLFKTVDQFKEDLTLLGIDMAK